jgi:hypothetical protein
MRYAALLLLAVSGAACHAPGTPAPEPTPATVVTPTAAAPLNPAWLMPGADTMVITRTGTASAVSFPAPDRVIIGSTIERLQRTRDDRGSPQFVLAFEERDGTGEGATTTTWVDATTLLPRSQRAELEGNRTVTLHYGPGRVTTFDSVPGHVPDITISPLPVTAYSAASLDLVLRALPLTEGFTTTLPIYFPADRLIFPMRVQVGGAETVTTRSGRSATCWTVAAGFPGGITEHFWIEQQTHRMIRILAHADEMTLVRYDR